MRWKKDEDEWSEESMENDNRTKTFVGWGAIRKKKKKWKEKADSTIYR